MPNKKKHKHTERTDTAEFHCRHLYIEFGTNLITDAAKSNCTKHHKSYSCLCSYEAFDHSQDTCTSKRKL